MHRFFIENEDQILDQEIVVQHVETLKHMVRVLRITVGESCELIGEKKTYIGKVKVIEPENVVFEIQETRQHENESPIDITLFQGIPKGQKMELIIQKNVELGCE